jgi:hypothetical protein
MFWTDPGIVIRQSRHFGVHFTVSGKVFPTMHPQLNSQKEKDFWVWCEYIVQPPPEVKAWLDQ